MVEGTRISHAMRCDLKNTKKELEIPGKDHLPHTPTTFCGLEESLWEDPLGWAQSGSAFKSMVSGVGLVGL